MTTRALGLLACICVQAFAGAPWQTVLQEASQLAYQKLPPDLLEEAGFPTPAELKCKALNNTKLEDNFASEICRLLPKEIDHHDTQQACSAAVAFAWKQEAAEEQCPGAVKSWWPFHVLHIVANKLICYQLKKGKNFHDKEKEITAHVCKELSEDKLSKWACDAAMQELWIRYEKDCRFSDLSPEDVLKQLTKADDIHV